MKKQNIELIDPLADFKPIPCFENYIINPSGTILSYSRFKKPIQLKPMKIGRNYQYEYVVLYKEGKRNVFYIHELLGITFLGYSKNKDQYIRHINGQAKDNRLSNLEITNKQK